MVTRTEGEDWIVLQAQDHGYGVTDGTVFRWADSFCSRMVEGRGPRIAPRSASVPAYASAAIGRQVKIGAYVGVPLLRPDGALLGTLCAIDPTPQPEAIVQEQALVELLGALLSTLCRTSSSLPRKPAARNGRRPRPLTDSLTGLYNRRGWSRLLLAEEDRCRRYGHRACVVAADLDDLKRINDTQGHGAGELAILGVECERSGAEALVSRARAALNAAGVQVSLGLAMRDPAHGLERAWAEADKAMYADKHRS